MLDANANVIKLDDEARALPGAWRSSVLGRAGTETVVKVVRMDATPLAEEQHETPEALIVLDGRLRLRVAGRPVDVGAGEMYVVPAATPHAVLPGSRGTLLIVEAA
ncbi:MULTISPECIES: cupin domain-containing protein [Streptomyces]|uniref:Cupin domain-containing protein n=1 Tax=Streptomyces luteosporeus TaxID=173856 RepID=A0ABP6G4C3_9ACTN